MDGGGDNDFGIGSMDTAQLVLSKYGIITIFYISTVHDVQRVSVLTYYLPATASETYFILNQVVPSGSSKITYVSWWPYCS